MFLETYVFPVPSTRALREVRMGLIIYQRIYGQESR